MFPHNTSGSGEQVIAFLESIKNKLDQLPDSCIETILFDLQAISDHVDYLIDGTHDCRKAPVHSKKTLVNKALAMSNITLRKSQELLRVAMANAPVAVFQTDLELRYTWFYSPFLGWIAEQFVGKRDDEIFPRESIAEFLDLKWTALKNKEVVRQELFLNFGDQQRTLIVSVEPFYSPGEVVAGVIGSFLDVTEQRRLEAREVESAFMLEVNRRLLEGRELERQQIARHLHDGPIQDLSSLGFSIQIARSLSPDSEISGVLEQVSNGVKNLVGDLREVTNELRPPGLIRFGLTNAIRVCADDFKRRQTHISVKLSLAKAVNQIPENVSLALYRIFQESLTNIARHAGANEVSVRLTIEQGKILMEIKDDGHGFQLPRSWVEFTRNGCYGLVLMRERAESVGGEFKIYSRKQEGTTLLVTVQRNPTLIPVTGRDEKRFIR